MSPKALIAMSGGVDSSVAAYLMKRAGYECIGATMRLYDNEDAGISKDSTCCSLNDVEDARSVAFRLDIPFYVFNFSDDFRKNVIDRFIKAYESGATPNPCIDCNRYLKFDRFLRRACELGCDYIVTGHYAVIEKNGDRFFLKKAADKVKDQSYVLYSLTQEKLAHTLFPLGGMSKDETRRTAEEQGFINARKHDSQDICFVPDGKYADVIRLHTGKEYPHGKFIDRSGKVLGEHKGLINYTLGQRKGLGLALPEPMYVCEKRLEDNTVILGRNEDLMSSEFDVSGFNWIAYSSPPGKIRVKVKVRYSQSEQWAAAIPTGGDTLHIVFEEPQRAITAGQAAVLYDGDFVVGGGTIC